MLFKLGPWGRKWDRLGVNVFYIAYIKNVLNHILDRISKGLIFDIRSPSGTLSRLFKLWFCGQNGIFLNVKEFMRLLLLFGSLSRCRGLVCSELWHFLFILTLYMDLLIVKA